MDKWFKSKWFVRAISLAFAILLFVFVNVESNTPKTESSFVPGAADEMETLDDIPLHVRMDEDRYVVSGVPEYVAVSLEGSNSILTPTVRQRNFKAYIDLEGLGAGEHTVEVSHENVPNGLSVYIEPKTIDVTIEERETKEFNVNVDFINTDQLTEGYEVGEPELDPDTITITSSKSIIDQIAMVKVFVDVADLTDNIKKREVPVNVYDSQGNELNVNVQPETVTVSAELLHPSKSIPIKVPTKGKPPKGYELTSVTPEKDEITVYGTTNSLEDIKNISTNEIDLSKVKDSETVDATLDVPDGMQVDDDQVEVKVESEKKDSKPKTGSETISPEDSSEDEKTAEKETTDIEGEEEAEENEVKEEVETKAVDKTLQNVPIELEGIEEDQDVSIIQPDDAVTDVTAEGKKSNMTNLTVDDVRVWIDASGLEEGEHKIPITIEGPDSIHYDGALKDVTIEVNSHADE